jgi:hypothetical protein
MAPLIRLKMVAKFWLAVAPSSVDAHRGPGGGMNGGIWRGMRCVQGCLGIGRRRAIE